MGGDGSGASSQVIGVPTGMGGSKLPVTFIKRVSWLAWANVVVVSLFEYTYVSRRQQALAHKAVVIVQVYVK